MQLEGAQAVVLEGAEVDGDGVGGASDDLALHQERLVGQDGQGGAVHPADGQQLPLRQVDTLHLGTVRGRHGETESCLSRGPGGCEAAGAAPRNQPLVSGTEGSQAERQSLAPSHAALTGRADSKPGCQSTMAPCFSL